MSCSESGRGHNDYLFVMIEVGVSVLSECPGGNIAYSLLVLLSLNIPAPWAPGWLSRWSVRLLVSGWWV